MDDQDLECLSAYLDGELSADEAAAVEENLSRSPDWSDARKVLAQADAWLRQGEESPILSIVPRLDGGQEARRRLQRDAATRGRRGLYLSALVVGVVLAGLALLSGWEPSTPVDTTGPGAQAPTVSGGPPAPEEPAATNDLSVDAQETPEDAQPVDPASFLSLEGTALGSNPSAVILNLATGTQKVYRVGQLVLEGVTLKDVTSKVAVLDRNGEEIQLRAGALKLEPPVLKTVDGLWRMILHVAGEEEEYHDLLSFRAYGTKLSAVNSKDESPFASGSIDEREVMLQFNDNGIVYVMRGTLDLELDSLTLHFEGATPYEGVDPQDVELRLTRVQEEDLADITELAALRKEVDLLREALLKFAHENESRFPLTLDALVPDYLETLEPLMGSQNTKLDFQGGLRLAQIATPPSLRFEDFQTGFTWDYRLKEWDSLLMRSYGGEEWLHPESVLLLACQKPAVSFTLMARGDIYERLERPEHRGPEDISETAERNAWISRDRTNLEELGVAIRMFQNEHEGYTPGGWASTYPAYLKEPSLLSSPKDEPGADSYLYLYPATNLDRLIAERARDPDIWDTDPEAARTLQTQIPILLNRTDFSGEQAGRNVLFTNWEVRFVLTNSPEWREQIAPYLSLGR